MSAVMRLLLGLSMGAMLLSTELSARTVEEANAAIRDGNQELGLSILRELANAGDLDAMYHLSQALISPISVAQIAHLLRNPPPLSARQLCQEMINSLSLAAQRAHPPSMREFGFMHDPRNYISLCENELTPLRNQRTAAAWIQRAAQAGDIEAQIALGHRYEEGNGVLQDGAQAGRWFGIAARRSVPFQSAKAQAYLAQWYRTRGDYVRAHAWFNISATNGQTVENTSGFGTSDRDRDYTAFHFMNQQQIERAQSLARGCMESQYRNCD
jgi:TPR repeat protein